MKVFLVVQNPGPMHGQKIPIATATFTIGRDPQCSLEAGSPSVAEQHCAVEIRADKVFVRDLDSATGTLVNDVRIAAEVQLKEGDRLKVGPLLFRVGMEAAPKVDVSLVVQVPGPMQGKSLQVSGPTFTIGRDPKCSLQAGSPTIAETHCVLEMRADQVVVRDLQSDTGTMVNDARITGEIQLKNGDRLQVGPLLFQVAIKAGKMSKPAQKEKARAPRALPKAAPEVHDASHAAQLLLRKYLRSRRD
jgi:pSer/pThr/pTyr-binding forkhead associated (FHA) protein